jgi:hypothetical protein
VEELGGVVDAGCSVVILIAKLGVVVDAGCSVVIVIAKLGVVVDAVCSSVLLITKSGVFRAFALEFVAILGVIEPPLDDVELEVAVVCKVPFREGSMYKKKFPA